MVSIHAPVKGATLDFIEFDFVLIVSIHAPVKGATRRLERDCRKYRCFNPRTREGCDIIT